MSDIIHTFIAVDLPEKIYSSIEKIQEELKSHRFKIRWVRPRNIHLTLKFLGNAKKSDVDRIAKAAKESVKDIAPFSLFARGIGVFPNIKRPRVLWVGVCGQMDMLLKMQSNFESQLETVGFKKECKPFKGHLTFARIKDKVNSKKLIQALSVYSEFESESFVIGKVILYKSQLKPSGPVYSKLYEMPL